MSVEEFKSTMLMSKVPTKTSPAAPIEGALVADPSIPTTFDWYVY